MNSLKPYITPFLLLTILTLSFFLHRRGQKIDSLQAELDLSIQSQKSKQVDKEVRKAQGKVDTLSQEIKKPVSKDRGEIDKFWTDYAKRLK